MRRYGGYLWFIPIGLRAVEQFRNDRYIAFSLWLCAIYGMLLLLTNWMSRQKPAIQGTYLAIQAVLVVGMIATSRAEDYFAILFVPLSLSAVYFFGRRTGYLWIAGFSLAMLFPLLTAEEGPIYALAMTGLYTGFGLLFGGYASALNRADSAREQNRHMLTELQASHRQLQDYSAELENLAIERERNRLARDLHDSVTQTVFSMNLTVQAARIMLGKDMERVTAQLIRLEQLAASAMSEIQVLLNELRPQPEEGKSLLTALRKLASDYRLKHGLQANIEVIGDQPLPEPVVSGLYRIAQEAFHNVVKHSGTLQVDLKLNFSGENPCLEIEDKGRGFDLQEAARLRGHLGLASMAERAQELGWKITFASSPGQGTLIRLVRENPS